MLLKVSRYRLTHGDGKERAFRKGMGAKGTSRQAVSQTSGPTSTSAAIGFHPTV